MLPTETKQFTCTAEYRNCNGLPSYYNKTSSSTWTSYDEEVATVNDSTPKGLVTGQSGGSAPIHSQFNGYGWYYNYYLHACFSYNMCANGASDANVCDMDITDPTQSTLYHLGGTNYNRATVPLTATSACSGTANWTFNYSYTSQRPTTYTSSSTTSSTLGQTSNYQTPVKNGGQVSLEARATLLGQSFTVTRTVYIDGVAIPDATITNRLVALYTSGATPRLLTGIASKESSYRQFAVRTLYGVSGRWPIENAANQYTPAGSYVGLMQVPNGMVNAFDWLTNTQQGAYIFQTKLTDAGNYVANLRSQYPQLPALNGVELENEALSRYGGFINDRYYTVNGSGNGWVITTRQDLLNYVQFIRNNMR
jgi:hypothetical protein